MNLFLNLVFFSIVYFGACFGERNSFRSQLYNIYLPQECGVLQHDGSDNNITDKIFGGRNDRFGQTPWIAVLGYSSLKTSGRVDYSSVRCAGSLITQYFVITAAHCVQPLIPLEVRLGVFDTSDQEHAGYYGVKTLIINRDHNPVDNKYDIALIRLKEKVEFTDFIQPICLPINRYLEMSFGNHIATVSGWRYVRQGILGHSPRGSMVLQQRQVRVRSQLNCFNNGYSHRQICAGGKKGEDSCHGDSGGPLTWNNDIENRYYLIGLVSYGSAECGIGKPGIYTRITSHIGWIMKAIMMWNPVEENVKEVKLN